jgi:hypothetical protein
MRRPRNCQLCRRSFKPKTDRQWVVVRSVHEHSFRHMRAQTAPVRQKAA